MIGIVNYAAVRIIVISGCAALTGCAGMVTANDGGRVTIEHDSFTNAADVRDVALKACRQNGQADAVFVAKANKNPRFDPGVGVQLSTFQCRQ